MNVTWKQVATWRMKRQFVHPRTKASASEIVGRLCGVQAQVWSAAELAVALRQTTPDGDAVDRDVADLTLLKTWAMRGTLHLLRPQDAGAFLSLMAAAGSWLKPSWTKASGVSPKQVDELTDEVSQILEGGAELTRDQLVTKLIADKRFAGMEERLRSGWGSVLKPLAWRGALCHGPNQGNKITFTSPAKKFGKDWKGVPEPDDAAPIAIEAYLGAYGPASPDTFDRWLTLNSTSKPKLRKWFADMGDKLTEVDVEGRKAMILTEHADDLAGSADCKGVKLLGHFDQYILGPGTKDDVLLDAKHRSKVSRTAGWISPIVVVDGRIEAVWEIEGKDLVVTPFDGAVLPEKDLQKEATHVGKANGVSGLTVRVV
ncbi:winged helix DNA-binding domain-containing protein [Dactylosporangium sp. NPDC049742]|uniref:winged helix DNA-binding domain-containing protein n=1 Tax=Dactylosporangium sp. NPDC049742 TaxID=3154737 RepID=UPI00341FD0D2